MTFKNKPNERQVVDNIVTWLVAVFLVKAKRAKHLEYLQLAILGWASI